MLGRRVSIDTPIRVADSLVFDDTLVKSKDDLEHCIVLPEMIVDCRHDHASVRERR